MTLDPGKTLIVTKVFDKDCEICKHMSKHDRATFEGFPEIAYQEVLLPDVLEHGGNTTKLRLYSVLERYAVNPDYTLDLPAYVFLSRVGEYKGHLIGAASIGELREKIQEILEDPPE
jgi:hypothetical protein